MDRTDLSLFSPLRDAYEAARAVRTPEDLVAVLDGLAELIRDQLGWGNVVVNTHRRAWDDFEVTVVSGNADARRKLLGTTQTWTQWAPLFADRYQQRGAYLIPHDEAGAATADLVVYDPGGPVSADPDAWHPHDMLLVHMRGSDGELAGILSVDEPADGRRPTDVALDALVAVANIGGAALHHAHEAAAEARHRAALEHLLAVSATIADARSAGSVLDSVCTGIRDALGFERVIVELADDHGNVSAAAQAGWEETPHDPLALGEISKLFQPEYEEHGCYLLERPEALAILGGSGPVYDSQRNGAGPWAWHHHWLIVPLRDPSGRLVGYIWPDDPEDCLRPDTPRLQALRLFADQAQAALEAARHHEQTLHMARHDSLTGLPNRRVLLERLQHALLAAKRRTSTVAVLFIDFDRFKSLNDTHGHEVGDEVLRIAGARIDETMRPGDTVARLGGDELVVLCEDVRDGNDAIEIARRLRAVMSRPITVGGVNVQLTMSIGIALPAGATEDAHGLLGVADVAMYRAKEAGGDREELASPAMRAGASARAQLESALGGALTRGEMKVYWQPIVSVADGSTVRLEALSRWLHPGLGWVQPLEFIPIAEETGFIVELGRWVLEQGCAQWAAWHETYGEAAPGIAINLSPRQLNDPQLLDLVAGLLARHRMPPGALCVEITEGVLLEAGPTTENALSGLQALGVELDLDDFGTGYSSLSSLERFHVDGLKIDRGFVSGRERDPRAGAIVEALLLMARALGVRATAEGVETPEQLEWLAGAGCEHAQGYHFARPQPAEDVAAFLAEHLSTKTA